MADELYSHKYGHQHRKHFATASFSFMPQNDALHFSWGAETKNGALKA